MNSTNKNQNTTESKLIDVDHVFASKNPALHRLIPGFIIRYLKRLVHQDEINDFLERNSNHTEIELVNASLVELFNATVEVKGVAKIPLEGRYLFVSNHPLGGLDGVAFMTAVGSRFQHLKFPVNDILLNIKTMKDWFIPINKHGANSKRAAQLMNDAFSSDSHVLYFPAGLVSRKIKGEIIDLPWKTTFLKKAITYERSIVPVHISGRNSDFFYNLANLRKNLGIKSNFEMLWLAEEMFKLRDKKIVVSFGEPIPYQDLKNNNSAFWTTKIREKCYALK